MRTLELGAQRATTSGNAGRLSISASDILSNTEAIITMEEMTAGESELTLFGMMPTSRAMDIAVCR